MASSRAPPHRQQEHQQHQRAALVPAPTTQGLVEQHQQFEALRDQLFACVDQLRRVQLVDAQTLGFKLGQLDDAQSAQASLRQQLEQQHADLSRLRNDCIRFETENAGLRRDLQVLKNEARTRQAKHQEELLGLENLLDTRDGDARAVQRRLTDLKFDHEDAKLQLSDCQAEVAQLRAELKGYEQEAATVSAHSSAVKQEADGEIRQLRKERHALLSKVEALEQRLAKGAEDASQMRQQMRDLRVADGKKDEILHTREDTIVTLERRSAQASSELETTKMELSSQCAKVVELESELQMVRSEFERVTQSMKTQLSQSTALSIRDAGAQRSQLAELQEQHHLATAELAELRREKQHWDERLAGVTQQADRDRTEAAARIAHLEGDVRMLLQNVKASSSSLKNIGDRAASGNRQRAAASAAPKLLSKEEQAKATADDIRAQMADWQVQHDRATAAKEQAAQQQLLAQYREAGYGGGDSRGGSRAAAAAAAASSALVAYEGGGGGDGDGGDGIPLSPASRVSRGGGDGGDSGADPVDVDDEVLRDAALLEQHLRRSTAARYQQR